MGKETGFAIGLITYAGIGALVGWATGMAIEDCLSNYNIGAISYYLDSFSLYGAGAGAVGSGLFHVIKYTVSRGYRGELDIKGKKFEESLEEPVIQEEGHKNISNDDLTKCLESLVFGLVNQGLGKIITEKGAKAIRRGPLDAITWKVNALRNGFMTNLADVFSPFSYEERTIYPKSSIDKLLSVSEKLYSSTLGFITAKLLDKPTNENLKEESRAMVNEMVDAAKEISLWANYLSQNTAIVGNFARRALAKAGIDNPDYLPRDVAVLGERILKLYDTVFAGTVK